MNRCSTEVGAVMADAGEYSGGGSGDGSGANRSGRDHRGVPRGTADHGDSPDSAPHPSAYGCAPAVVARVDAIAGEPPASPIVSPVTTREEEGRRFGIQPDGPPAVGAAHDHRMYPMGGSGVSGVSGVSGGVRGDVSCAAGDGDGGVGERPAPLFGGGVDAHALLLPGKGSVSGGGDSDGGGGDRGPVRLAVSRCWSAVSEDGAPASSVAAVQAQVGGEGDGGGGGCGRSESVLGRWAFPLQPPSMDVVVVPTVVPAPAAGSSWSLPLRRPPSTGSGAASAPSTGGDHPSVGGGGGGSGGSAPLPLPLADRPLGRPILRCGGGGGGGLGGGAGGVVAVGSGGGGGRFGRRGPATVGGGSDKACRARRSRRHSRSTRGYVVLDGGGRAHAAAAAAVSASAPSVAAVAAAAGVVTVGGRGPALSAVAGGQGGSCGASMDVSQVPPVAAAVVSTASASAAAVVSTASASAAASAASGQRCPPPPCRPRPAPPPTSLEDDGLSGLPDEPFAAAVAAVLDRWMDANARAAGGRPPPAPDDPLSQFFSSSRQPFTLLYYVRRLVTHTRCSRSAYVAAFVYLDRLAAAAPSLAIRTMNVHRLVLTALVVAVKVLDDDVYSAAYYCRVGGIPSVGEYVALEATLLRLLDFRVAVGLDVYRAYEKGILRAAAAEGRGGGTSSPPPGCGGEEEE